MTETQKSVVTASVIAGVLISLIGGAKYRDFSELRETARSSGVSPLLVSTEKSYQIAEVDYYESLKELLSEKFYDKMPEESKLLSGAVRGMIVGLRDVESQFYNPIEFSAFKSIRAGVYTGVGVWLDYKPFKSTVKMEDENGELMLPRLTVISVAKGSAADKAGVKPGDFVEEINGQWVQNTDAVLKYRKVQADYLAKKIDFKTINDMRKELKRKVDSSILPARAREKLISGTNGALEVTWERDGKLLKTSLEKSQTSLSVVPSDDGSLPLYFTSGTPEILKKFIEGKSEVTIDLRNNVLGDIETMRKCLEVVAPPGNYGQFVNQRKGKPVPLEAKVGNPKPPKIKLLVDESTRDAAEIFAVALSGKANATLSGGETGGSTKLKEVSQLPDGSGYVLTTGSFQLSASKVNEVKK